MLLLNPRRVRFAGTAFEDVAAIVVDRSAAKEIVQRPVDLPDVAVGQGRGDESHDLTVGGAGIGAGPSEGIAADQRGPMVALIEPFDEGADAGRAREAALPRGRSDGDGRGHRRPECGWPPALKRRRQTNVLDRAVNDQAGVIDVTPRRKRVVQFAIQAGSQIVAAMYRSEPVFASLK